MRIIAIGADEVGPRIAGRLGLPAVSRVSDIVTDDFVLDGSALGVGEARALDAVLRLRASEVDAVLWLDGGDPEVLDHYTGRVIALDPARWLDSALDGLREVLVS